MLSLGIVGCGRVTRMFHVKAIDQISDLCIGAVSDVDAMDMNKVKNRTWCSRDMMHTMGSWQMTR